MAVRMARLATVGLAAHPNARTITVVPIAAVGGALVTVATRVSILPAARRPVLQTTVETMAVAALAVVTVGLCVTIRCAARLSARHVAIRTGAAAPA